PAPSTVPAVLAISIPDSIGTDLFINGIENIFPLAYNTDMSVITIPRSIRERLGDEASEDFVALINDIDIGARKDAIAIAEERFERRLVEESSKLRIELRIEMEKVRSEVNERITEESGKLRVEIGKVNERITEESGKLRIEIEKVRSEVERSGKENIKWMFLFWIGQLAAIGALFKFFAK
ncbi:MAG: DUF1640 domain-containing protein, partial [Nitrospirae bacterium]|nr:DUF1640 domain-containing protein [Nitrospirota bacterium]